MRSGWPHLGFWHLLVVTLWLAPPLALAPLGALWLHEAGWLRWWLVWLLLSAALGLLLLWWLRRRERIWLAGSDTRPDPLWSPRSALLWTQVESFASALRPADWPLDEPQRLAELGRQTLECVAREVHPELEEPVLELTLPHTLLIIERAARDLRETLLRELPFSHRLRLGALVRLYRWRAFAERLLGLYRVGQWALNPLNALLGEVLNALRGQSFSLAREELHAWLLREYVRKVGYYAIALYGEPPVFDAKAPDARPTPRSTRDLAEAERAEDDPGEPLRILVLGRANAGKSSLINALFGELRAATDAVADTTAAIQPLRLRREGLDLALVFDTPGLESMRESALCDLAAEADLLLWVSPAQRPDRQLERERLDALRAFLASRPERRAPPLLVAVSHIDRLRPPRFWSPPYDLNHAEDPKAASIRAALLALGQDLAVAPSELVPVCLGEGRLYNIEEGLWVAILARLDEARRARLVRARESQRRGQDWALLWNQLGRAGRRLLAMPEGKDARSD
ncbi:MAG: 50S ribosome-binding GTPase [Chromatiaceae bacterium]|nr:50S ribosome-binding GTPase [Chromatiaceae bacterium]